jgi:hypothetical protein
MSPRTKACLLLLLPVPLVAYLMYFLEPSKAYRVIDRVQEASDRRDIDAARVHFCDRYQTGEREEWRETTPELVAQRLGWHNPRRASLPRLQYEWSQGLELMDPLHRYVIARPLDSLPATTVIRLRWTGLSWKIDGDWGYGCLRVEAERPWLSCWIPLG